MEKSTNTTAHKWLRKVIQEHGSSYHLSAKTGIPVNNFYYWLKKEIEEGEDLIDKVDYVITLKNTSKFRSLHLKLKPSLKKLK